MKKISSDLTKHFAIEATIERIAYCLRYSAQCHAVQNCIALIIHLVNILSYFTKYCIKVTEPACVAK